MNLDQIERGDTVRVVLSTSAFQGVVLYTPCATGDCWHIMEQFQEVGNRYLTDGALRYVHMFEEIVLVEKANPNL